MMPADGGEAISDQGLRDRAGLVASTATAWRVLDGIDQQVLTRVRRARAETRERAWLGAAAAAGRGRPGY